MFAAINTLLARPAQGPTDQYLSSVTVMLHGNGANGSTNIVDSSANALSMTNISSGVTVNTAVSKFGTGSMYFPGTSNLTNPNTATALIGLNNDFTIEFWVYLSGTQGAWKGFCGNYLDAGFGSRSSWAIGLGGSGTGVSSSVATSTNGTHQSTYLGTSEYTLASNTWYHIAFVRSGSTFTQYVNGTSTGSFTYSGSIYDGGSNLEVGSYINGAYRFTGYMDEFRITKGVARYTANFTPQTAEFADSAVPPPTSVSPPPSVSYFIAAGGGAGGYGQYHGGGGGAGGYKHSSMDVSTGTAYTATVGGGGWGSSNGGNSSFFNVTATGGGYGSSQNNYSASSGGSGGGGMYSSGYGPGAGIAGQGNAGGTGDSGGYYGSGGGGGAGSVGGTGYPSGGGAGGTGIYLAATGLYYCGGGGGSSYTITGGAGGAGGGGTGSINGGVGDPGTTNRGGGGGGSERAGPSYNGGSGGSGVVIIYYSSTYNDAVSTTGSPTYTNNGTNKIYTFTGSGSITF